MRARAAAERSRQHTAYLSQLSSAFAGSLEPEQVLTTVATLSVPFQPVDLPAVVRDALATVAPAAEAKGVRLQSVLEPDVGRVSGDPDRLQQVFWNLLSNAVKFTPRGGRVQLRLQRVNSHVELSVSDTGIGIREESCRICSSGSVRVTARPHGPMVVSDSGSRLRGFRDAPRQADRSV